MALLISCVVEEYSGSAGVSPYFQPFMFTLQLPVFFARLTVSDAIVTLPALSFTAA